MGMWHRRMTRFRDAAVTVPNQKMKDRRQGKRHKHCSFLKVFWDNGCSDMTLPLLQGLSGGLLVPRGFFCLFQKRYKGIYRGIYTLIALVFSITVTESSDEREYVRTSRFTGLASSVTLAGSFMAITTGLFLQPHNHPRSPSRKLCNTVIFVPLGHSNVY